MSTPLTPWYRDSAAMFRLFVALLIGVIIGAAWGCRPPERQPVHGDDSTPVVSLPDTMDSVGTDAQLTEEPGEGDGPELTADDTLRTSDDSAFITRRQAMRGASRGGLPTGASQYPPDKWCTVGLNATTANSAPGVVAGIVRKASDCGMSVVIVPPRRLFTTNGENRGPFSATKYKAMIDQYRTVLTPAFVAQYGPKGNRTIIGFQVFDDSKCNVCWGTKGTIIPSSVVADLARYVKSKLPPDLPRGVRIEPSLLLDYRGWQAGDLDYTVYQYTTKKGDQARWYRYQDSLARVVVKSPMAMYQVSLGDITPPDGPQITVSQLHTYMTTALTFNPAKACGGVSWMWESFFGSGSYKTEWASITLRAKATPWQSCKPGTGTAISSFTDTSSVAVDTATPAPPVVATESTTDQPQHPHRKH